MSTSLPPQASFTENTDKANMRRLFSRPQTRSGGALLRKMVAPGNPEERAWRKLMGSESTVYQQEHGQFELKGQREKSRMKEEILHKKPLS